MKVQECMCKRELIWVKANASIREIADIMLDKHVGCVVVCNDKRKIEGIITDRDLVTRVLATDKEVDTIIAKDIMTTKVYDIEIDKEVEEASKIMCDCQVKRVPVVQNEQAVGMITLRRFSK